MKPATTFYLIRHGATDWIRSAIAGWTPGVHLNQEGREQAAVLAEALVHAQIGHVYCSPLERARETAAPLAQKLGLEPQIVEQVGEVRFGNWTGKLLSELAADPEWARWNSFRAGGRIPNGESMLEVQSRVVGFMQRSRLELPGETVAVFSHGDPIRAALLYYLGMPLDFVHRLEISPASVSIVRVDAYGPQILGANRLAGASCWP